MKIYLLTIILNICCIAVSAQQKLSFSVLEFEQDMFDTSAKSSEYGKKDGNGSWYAIIKVTSNNPDDDITACQFNFGNMASKVEKHDEALWVYVQRNAKKVTISRPGYHTISQHDLQTTIEAGANYKMVLTSDRVQQQVVYDVKMQMVKFQTSPAVQGAIVTVTNESTGKKESVGVTGNNGAVSKALNFGRYAYEVLSSDNLYHPSDGIITLNNSDEVHTENIKLRPNFAEVTLSVANDAEIYINNELKGKGKWAGRLSPGEYIVSGKKANHRDSQQKIVVEDGKPQNLMLTAPTPITGILTINTDPTDATITIDGKDYGKSPKIIKDLLVGIHEVVLSLSGYKKEKKSILIEEGKMANIDIKLRKDVSQTSTSIHDAQTFTVGDVSFTMIAVEGGTFTMGATLEQNKPFSGETPTHQVTLSSYHIGETEVTQALWQAVMGSNPSHFKGDQRPVEEVSWDDCQTFISKLNQATGKKFRLPTEAEWEFAARGGNKSLHTQYSGSSNIDEVAWYAENSGIPTYPKMKKVYQTQPVKLKKANELGIYDMTGNVSEWCQDWYGSYSSSAQTNPIGRTSGSTHIIRGGSWQDFGSFCRSSHRSDATPDIHNYRIGLRLALSD